MGKEHVNTAHYKEICSVLDAWIEEEEETELKTTIDKVKPLIKVQNWSYVDEYVSKLFLLQYYHLLNLFF